MAIRLARYGSFGSGTVTTGVPRVGRAGTAKDAGFLEIAAAIAGEPRVTQPPLSTLALVRA